MNIKRMVAICLTFCFLLMAYPNAIANQEPVSQYSNNQIIIKYKNENAAALKNDFSQKANMSEVKTKEKLTMESGTIELLEVEGEERIDDVLERLKQKPEIEYVEPNFMVYSHSDPKYPEQWGLQNNGQSINGKQGIANIDINMMPIRETVKTLPEITVAVIDSGTYTIHGDLQNNIFINTEEQPDGIDNDGNGYIDDVNGWNFLDYVDAEHNGSPEVFSSHEDDKHGTHVAGIIAGEINDFGIEGVFPNCKILPVKFIKGEEGGTIFNAIKSIQYAESMGAQIANCSWGSTSYSRALQDAISMSKMLFVCSAGNDGLDTEQNPTYPANYDLDNVISVASIDNSGNLSESSNYGNNISIAAPGTDILSTLPGNTHGYLSGTSMAAPFVTGAAAIIKSQFPSMTSEEVVQRIKMTAKNSSALAGKTSSGGSLDITAAFRFNNLEMDVGQKRYAAGTANINGETYIIGGHDGIDFSNSVRKYNPVISNWEDSPSMLIARAHAGVAAVTDCVFVLGGYNGQALNVVEKYDAVQKSWSTAANLPAAMFAMGTVAMNDKIYIFGGKTSNGYTNSVYMFDTAKNTWSKKADMPYQAAYLNAVELNGKIYIIGGLNEDGCLNKVYEYSTDEDVWTERATLPYYTQNATALPSNGKIFLFGGTNENTTDVENGMLFQMNHQNQVMMNSFYNTVSVYDAKKDTWEKTCPMDEVRIGFNAVESYNKIFLIGGWNGKFIDTAESYFGAGIPQNIVCKTGQNSMVFSWDAVDGATGYELEINGQIFVTSTNKYTFQPESSISVDGASVRIRAVKNGKCALWSELEHYTSNGSMIDAKRLSFDFSITDTLYHAQQTKWYKVSAGRAGTVNLSLSNVPSGCDYIMQFLNSSGEAIATGTSEISNIVVSEYDYYITVTSVGGGSAAEPYTLSGNFTAATTENVPDRVKAFLRPSMLDDSDSFGSLGLKNISEYEGEDQPDSVTMNDTQAASMDNGGSGTMGNEPMPEEILAQENSDGASVTPMSMLNSDSEIGSISQQGGIINRSVIVPANTPSSAGQKLKLVVHVVPENSSDEYSVKWTGSNTEYSNFRWNWHGESKVWFLTALLPRSSTGNVYNYQIKCEQKATGSSGKFTIDTYMIADNAANEDFKTETGNDGPDIADTLSVATNMSATQYGKIDHPEDWDFYKVAVSANQKLTAVVESPNGKCYPVSILNHTGSSSEWNPSQHMDGWYDQEENVSWATIQTGSSSRNYIVAVNSKDKTFSPDETYKLTVSRYSISRLGDLEVNNNFSDADNQMSLFANSYLGTPEKVAAPIRFCIDSPVDEDRYAIQLDAGDKISVQMTLPNTYDDTSHQYRIAICSDVNETSSGIMWQERSYNNPNSTNAKSVTFIAKTAGRYYVSVSSLTRKYDCNIMGTVAVAKTPKSYLDSNENKNEEYGCTNDFVFTTIGTLLGYELGVEGWTPIAGSTAANFDNQLDVDWYGYQNGNTYKNTIITLSGSSAVTSGCGLVILDRNYNILSQGGADLTHNFAPGEMYYIGAYVKDDQYGSIIGNRDYTIQVQEIPLMNGPTLQLDETYSGCEEIWFTENETFVNLSKPIPAGKVVTVSFIYSYKKSDGSFAPPSKASDEIEIITLYDQDGNGVELQGGWYDDTRMSYFKIDHAGYYKIGIKFKPGIKPHQAYISAYTTDHITSEQELIKYDALEQNLGSDNNYLIFNAPEHLSVWGQLGDERHYISKMPVSGNANIYWEHLNKFQRPMKYGILLHNTSDDTINVTINQKSAYAENEVKQYQTPLQIWNDYYSSSMTSDLTGINRQNNQLTLAPHSSEWIYLREIPGTSASVLFNGIINLSVHNGKTLDCYAFMMDSDANRIRLENDFNLYNRFGSNYETNYLEYDRADDGYGKISGTTNGPVLKSQTIDLSSGNPYRLLLTGYDAPFLNQGEAMPLIYDGQPVPGALGSNAQNFSVIYQFNISRFAGNRIYLQYNPYTNPNYLADPDAGLYVAYSLIQNGTRLKSASNVLLQPKYAGYSLEFDVDFGDVSIDFSQPFSVEVIVSGMSSMPLTVNFE